MRAVSAKRGSKSRVTRVTQTTHTLGDEPVQQRVIHAVVTYKEESLRFLGRRARSVRLLVGDDVVQRGAQPAGTEVRPPSIVSTLPFM
jgi:hypothetical protein